MIQSFLIFFGALVGWLIVLGVLHNLLLPGRTEGSHDARWLCKTIGLALVGWATTSWWGVPGGLAAAAGVAVASFIRAFATPAAAWEIGLLAGLLVAVVTMATAVLRAG